MKNYSLIGLCLLITGTTSISAESSKDTAWQLAGLKGKVSEMIETSYVEREKFGEVTKEIFLQRTTKFSASGNFVLHQATDQHGIVRLVTKYDVNGNKIENTEYNWGGSVSSIEAMKYDSTGAMVEQNFINNYDRKLSYRWLLKFDDTGKLAEKSKYSMEGILRGKHIIKYDSIGNMVNFAKYYEDGSEERKEFKYDAEGYVVEASDYNLNRELTTKQVTKYNAHNNILEDIVSRRDGSIKKKQHKYDPTGTLLLESNFYIDDKLISSESLKWDAMGRLVEATGWNPDGSMEGKSVIKYDTEGDRIEDSTYGTDGSLSAKTNYTYDLKRNLIRKLSYEYGSLVREIFNEYDSGGNRTEERFVDTRDPQKNTNRSYTYSYYP